MGNRGRVPYLGFLRSTPRLHCLDSVPRSAPVGTREGEAFAPTLEAINNVTNGERLSQNTMEARRSMREGSDEALDAITRRLDEGRISEDR